MLILVDENIPHARQVFGALGEVRLTPGRGLQRAALAGVDALMVRSVTRVDAALLEGTPVRFVGTATIGTEHIDQPWLASHGIGFASAPGSNAESVAQYMAAALGFAAGRLGKPLAGATLGIVGAGNCGRRVARVAHALGMRVLLNDPPLARETGDPAYLPLEALAESDYLALHVPLQSAGPDATVNLIDAPRIAALKPGAVIINACRGSVLNEAALAAALDRGHLAGAILDAWEHEPNINPAILRRTLLATPHIAGYSHDGKVNGTLAIYRAACAQFGAPEQTFELTLPPPAVPTLELDAKHRAADSVLAELALTAYPIHRDDHALRRAAATPETLPQAFDALRKNYPPRREFAATRIRLHNADEPLRTAVAALGFTLDPAGPA